MRYLSSGQTERKEKEIPELSFTSEEVENGSALKMMSSEHVHVYYVPAVVPVLVEKGLWEKERESGERWRESVRQRGKLEEGCVSFCFVQSTHAPTRSPVSMRLDDVIVCWLDTKQLLCSHKQMDTHPNAWFDHVYHSQMTYELWIHEVCVLNYKSINIVRGPFYKFGPRLEIFFLKNYFLIH